MTAQEYADAIRDLVGQHLSPPDADGVEFFISDVDKLNEEWEADK